MTSAHGVRVMAPAVAATVAIVARLHLRHAQPAGQVRVEVEVRVETFAFIRTRLVHTAGARRAVVVLR